MKKISIYLITFIILFTFINCDKDDPTGPDPTGPDPTSGTFKIYNKTTNVRVGWIYIDGGGNQLGNTRWIYPGSDWSTTLENGSHNYVIGGDLEPFDSGYEVEWTGAVTIEGGKIDALNLYYN